MSYDLGIKELQEKKNLEDQDLFIVEDEQNTKKVKLRDIITSIIKDDELPTEERIYSALKIKEMILELSTDYSDTINDLLQIIDELEKKAATKKMLEDVEVVLTEMISGRVTPEYVNRALDTRLEKDHKFTAADFDLTSDEYKIKLENLAEEVIAAITGETVMEVTNRAPKGGWRTEDLSDGVISSKKLATNYRFRGNYLEGQIDQFTQDGIYLLASTVLDMPSDQPDGDDELRVLFVSVYGDYIQQDLYYVSNIEYHPLYRRRCNKNRLHATKFIRIDEITDAYKINREMLSDDYAALPILSNTNIFSIKKEGNFIANQNCIGLPTKDKYFISVNKFDDYTLIYKAYNITTTKCDVYISLVYRLENYSLVTTDWFKTTSNSRSKFDGKKLHIFGDDIVFGIGASDMAKKSIPALLSSKYGFIVNNCALSDGTAASYGDEIMSRYDINEQIGRTSLRDTEYALIFVGSNDYRCGKASIGQNNNISLNSFKGGLNMAIANIMAANPKIKILLATPIYRDSLSNTNDGKNSDTTMVNDYYMADFTNAMIEVAKYNHLPILNLTDTCSINKYNASTYLSDGVHLNDVGQELIADKILDGFNQAY